MRISDVMTPCPHSIGSETSLQEALKMMALRNIRHLPVVDPSGDLLGVLGEHEAKLSQFVCESTSYCPVAGSVCRKDVLIVTENDPVSQVAADMFSKKLDCVLVADLQGNFTGIFTSSDACRTLHLLLSEFPIGKPHGTSAPR